MSIERFGSAQTGPGGKSLPFCKAVRAGEFVFVSGQVPMGEDGELVAAHREQRASPSATSKSLSSVARRRAGEGDCLARRHARFWY